MIISEVWAQTGTPTAGMDIWGMLPLLLMFVVLYFIMIRPQMKRAKEHKAMVEAVQKGDEVIAAGGMLGRISKLDENYISLQIAPNVEIQVQRGSIQVVLPKGTLKSNQ